MDTSEDLQDSSKNKMSNWLIAILVALIGAIGAVTANLLPIKCDSDKQPEIRILFPENMSEVPPTFTIQGTLKNIPSNKHLWLATKSGDLYWPKIEIPINSEKWIETFTEEGRDGKQVSVVLFSIDGTGNNQIANWKRNGERTGQFPGLSNLSNKSDLAAIQLIINNNLENSN